MRNNTFRGKLRVKDYGFWQRQYKIVKSAENCDMPRACQMSSGHVTPVMWMSCDSFIFHIHHFMYNIYIYIYVYIYICIYIYMYLLTYVLISTMYLANSLSYVKKLPARRACSQTRGGTLASRLRRYQQV